MTNPQYFQIACMLAHALHEILPRLLRTKHGQIPVKVCSQHINGDNCRYSHIHKSENPDFYQYPQIFGDVSQKFEDI